MKQENDKSKSLIDKINEKHQKALREHGWVAHFVNGDASYPNQTNYHTHGLYEKYHHLDLQICIPLQPSQAHSLFHAIVARIQEGFVYEPNKSYDNVLAGGISVKTIEVKEDNRSLLRIVLPDANGRYDAPLYKEQLKTHEDQSTRRKRQQ
jgi:hypothetical protein